MTVAAVVIFAIAALVGSYIAGWEHGKSILKDELEELRRSHDP